MGKVEGASRKVRLVGIYPDHYSNCKQGQPLIDKASHQPLSHHHHPLQLSWVQVPLSGCTYVCVFACLSGIGSKNSASHGCQIHYVHTCRFGKIDWLLQKWLAFVVWEKKLLEVSSLFCCGGHHVTMAKYLVNQVSVCPMQILVNIAFFFENFLPQFLHQHKECLFSVTNTVGVVPYLNEGEVVNVMSAFLCRFGK